METQYRGSRVGRNWADGAGAPNWKSHLLIGCLLSGSLALSIPSEAAVLTHGPVVGGVTSSNAAVFVRTDQPASVAIRYGTDPNWGSCQQSAFFQTGEASDFTRIIPLAGLPAQTKLYLNVIV